MLSVKTEHEFEREKLKETGRELEGRKFECTSWVHIIQAWNFQAIKNITFKTTYIQGIDILIKLF